MNHTTTPTLRLTERLLSSLDRATDIQKAAHLRAVIQSDPKKVDLVTVAKVCGLSGVPLPDLFREDTLARVSGLFGVPAHQFFKEITA